MKLLIIDDDPSIREILRDGLSSEGFTLTLTENATEGIATALEGEFGCILLDNILPDMSGITACRRMRKAGVETPIIGLSVRIETEQKVTFLNAGADDYVEKPFTFSELIARINAVTRRRAHEPKIIHEVGPLTVDTKNGVVTLRNKPVTLSNKEYALLECLLQHQGAIVTRAMLLEHVWDMKTDPFSNTIESHVASIRRKLGSTGKRLIKTISGRGYMIE